MEGRSEGRQGFEQETFTDSKLAHFWLCFTRIPADPLLQRRREMRLSVVDRAGFADRARVVRRTRGPRSPRRG
ncbi:hypothetical protein BRN51_11760 [Xanthomonas oryzae pv. oryzae]|nr:hypothetical protein BRN51_11760 [Xanthomonas oryzae pv. oryzae]